MITWNYLRRRETVIPVTTYYVLPGAVRQSDVLHLLSGGRDDDGRRAVASRAYLR